MSVPVDRLWIKQFYNNMDYRVDMTHAYQPTVYGYLTAPLVLSTRSGWSTMVESPFKEWSGVAQMTTGRSTQVWLATEEAWTGTEPISIQLTMAFIALENTKSEVVEPTLNLLKYPLPPDRTDPIKPPAKMPQKKGCSLFIGLSMYIPETDLVPVDAQVTYSTVKDHAGYPIRADATVSFKTPRAMSAVDLGGWFI
jgi:hypothetical protein